MTNTLKTELWAGDLAADELTFDDPATDRQPAGLGSIADIVGTALGWDLWQCGYRMTHAEIQIEHPNAPGVLRTMVWQDMDHAPDFPVLTAFLNDWVMTRDERVVSIRVVTVHDLTPDRLVHHGISVSVH